MTMARAMALVDDMALNHQHSLNKRRITAFGHGKHLFSVLPREAGRSKGSR